MEPSRLSRRVHGCSRGAPVGLGCYAAAIAALACTCGCRAPAAHTLVAACGHGSAPPQEELPQPALPQDAPALHAPVEAVPVGVRPAQHVEELPPLHISRRGDEPPPDRFPIDLPATLRLAGANNLHIALATQRVRQARARLDAAEYLWLPSLNLGVAYNYHNGRL